MNRETSRSLSEAELDHTPFVYPASFAQERLWFMRQLAPDSAVYQITAVYHLFGPLNRVALQQALNALVARHESLRTTFAWVDEALLQRVAPAGSWPVTEMDLRSVSVPERSARVDQLLADELLRPFDLERGPLVKSLLMQCGPEEHFLSLAMHHIISDGWSMGVLFRELEVLYSGWAMDQPSALAELPIQYVDYTAWQRERFAGEEFPSLTAYWRQRLDGVPAYLDFPLDRPRPRQETFGGHSIRLPLEAELAGGIKAFCQREQVTPFMVLMAAFGVLLRRYTGQTDLVVGTPMANRQRPELEGLVGLFANTLAVRIDVSGEPTFRQLLDRLKTALMEDFAHQEMPWEKLVECLAVKREVNRSPLIQVSLAVLNPGDHSLRLPPLECRPYPYCVRHSHFEFTLHAQIHEAGIACQLDYRTGLFGEARMQRLLENWRVLLAGIIAEPEAPVTRLPVLAEAERQWLLDLGARTDREYPRQLDVVALFEAQVKRNPQATALVCGTRSWSYQALNAWANRGARALRRWGVRRESPVALYLERSPGFVAAVLAVLKAGGAYVPLPKEYPAERLRFMLAQVAAGIVLADEPVPLEVAPPDGRIVDWSEFTPPAGEAGEGDNLDTPVDPDRLAYIMFTSGSTGQPKGVPVPQRAIIRLVMGQDYVDFGPGLRTLLLAPTAFDASTFELWASLLHGGCCVVYPERLPALERLKPAIDQGAVNCLWLTAGLFNLIMEQAPTLLESVPLVLTGGEALSVRHVQQALRALPHTRLINGYGPTESTTFACVMAIPAGSDFSRGSVPIGRPLANTTAYILDEQGQLAPFGVPGELCIGGDGLARGYLQDPELTARKFVADPFCGRVGARLYRTGDRCRWTDEGVLEYLGREDDQVKIRGYRIELGEIETVLRQKADIRQCVVVVVAAAKEAERELVAYVVRRDPGSMPFSPWREATLAWLKDRLPGQMIPGRWAELTALPLTSQGKVDRKALPEFSPGSAERATPAASPATPVESRIAAIPRASEETEQRMVKLWRELLAVESIRSGDNFFDLGGHSLAAIRLISQIHQAWGVDLPVSLVFSAPTVAELSAQVEIARQRKAADQKPPVAPAPGESRETAWTSLMPLQPKGSRPPLFLTHGWGGDVFGFVPVARRLASGQPVYGLQAPEADGRHKRHTRIEDMAAQYRQEIQAFYPRGPYCLGGFSLGGLIAYEVARQLAEQGCRVGLLMLIDTHVPHPEACLPWYEVLRRKIIHGVHNRGLVHWQRLRTATWADRMLYTRQRLESIRGWIGSVKQHRVAQPQPRSEQEILAASQQKGKHGDYFVEVAADYYPRPYPGHLTFLRPKERAWRVLFQPELDWRYLAAGGVTIKEAPGDHLGFLKSDLLPGYAQVIQECLDTVVANGLETAKGS